MGGEAWDPIIYFNPTTIGAFPKPEPLFPVPYVMIFFMFNGLNIGEYRISDNIIMFFVLFQTEPFPHGICEFDRRYPVDIDCSSRIVDPLPYQWVKLGAGFNGSSK